MKKIYILAIFMVLGFGLFAQTVTKVTKTILPLINSLPVVFQENISGGLHQVANVTARDALSASLKQTGMLVVLQDSHATYQWDGAAWRKVQLVRNWEEGATYFMGDIFVYFGSLVIAKGDGTITASYNPLTDTTNWYSSLGGSLGAGQILVGDANGVAKPVSMSGDALLDETGKLTVTSVPLSGDLTLDATGAATISDGKVTSAKILNNTIATDDLANGAVTVAKIGSEGGTDKVLTTTVTGVPQWEDRTNFASSELTAGHIFVGDAQGKATDVPMGGDIKIDDMGVTDIFPGVIENADVSSSAAILGTKIDPDFGSQNIVTTGNITGKNLLVGQTNTVTLQNAASLASSYTLTLPDALGANGQSLKTDASGNLSWGTALIDGTAANNTLRWNGTTSKWEESTALKNDGANLTASGNLNVTEGITTLSHATSDPLLLIGAGFKSQMATNAYSELVVDNTTGAIRKAPVITALSDVIDNTVSDPSSLSPNINDAWIVAATGAGDWAGHDNTIAKWDGSSWTYYSPAANDQTSVSTGANAGKVYTWSGTAWSTTLVASKSSLSQVTAATATNLIDNTNFAQTWNWSSATTENPLTFNVSALTTGTAMQINANALTTGNALSIASTGTGITTGSLLNVSGTVAATTVTNGLFSVRNTAASTTGTVATVQANSTAGSGITVLANGFVGIGTATPTVALDIVGDAKVSGTFSYPSDIRLKTKVETLTGVLSKLALMRGVTYEFKDQTKYAKGPQVGVIAQELQKVFPELVKEGSDGFLSVNYTQLSAVLIQAVKEQQARIDKLEEQMAAVMKQLGIK